MKLPSRRTADFSDDSRPVRAPRRQGRGLLLPTRAADVRQGRRALTAALRSSPPLPRPSVAPHRRCLAVTVQVGVATTLFGLWARGNLTLMNSLPHVSPTFVGDVTGSDDLMPEYS